ncbi:DNA polymerase III subunit gamma/tau C-terminal domain-containing protein, partial [Noviherbaspirillum galbum]
APARASTAMSPARAALEAARSGKPMPAMPTRSAPAATPASAASAEAPQPASAHSSSAVPDMPEPPLAPPPWEDDESAVPAVQIRPAAQKKTEQSAMTAEPAHAPASPVKVHEVLEVQAAAPRAKPRPAGPVAELGWDGDWPALAAALPLRGVVQQLAQQSELLNIQAEREGAQFHLRIPLETLRSAGSVDKLSSALTEHFGKPVRVHTEIGAVELTANAAAVAEREARQRRAEEDMQRDPFVQTLIREFGATIVPGSIKPA